MSSESPQIPGVAGFAPKQPDTSKEANHSPIDIQKQIEEIKKQKELLNAQVELQRARALLISAGLKETQIEAPKGDVDVKDEDQFGYLAEIAAYKAVGQVAKIIGEMINTCQDLTGNVKILMVDSLSMAQAELPLIQVKRSLRFYENGLSEQIALNQKILETSPSEAEDIHAEDHIAEGIPKMLSSAAMAGALGVGLQALPTIAAAVPPILGTAADIFSYFKRDQTIYNREIKISDDLLKSAVAGAIQKHTVLMNGFYQVHHSPLLDQYFYLAEQRLRLGIQISSLLELKDENGKAAATASQVLSNIYDTFVQSINNIPNGELMTTLTTAILSDQIVDLGVTHFLYLKVHSAGGEVRTKKGLWIRGGEISYMGAVAVNIVLAEKGGRILLGENLTAAVEIFHTLGSKGPLEIKEHIT